MRAVGRTDPVARKCRTIRQNLWLGTSDKPECSSRTCSNVVLRLALAQVLVLLPAVGSWRVAVQLPALDSPQGSLPNSGNFHSYRRASIAARGSGGVNHSCDNHNN